MTEIYWSLIKIEFLAYIEMKIKQVRDLIKHVILHIGNKSLQKRIKVDKKRRTRGPDYIFINM